jgi:hypothetical protein
MKMTMMIDVSYRTYTTIISNLTTPKQSRLAIIIILIGRSLAASTNIQNEEGERE